MRLNVAKSQGQQEESGAECRGLASRDATGRWDSLAVQNRQFPLIPHFLPFTLGASLSMPPYAFLHLAALLPFAVFCHCESIELVAA